MNTKLVSICGVEIEPKEHNDRRVVTFKDVDQVHGRPDGTARKRFNDNKTRFKIGEDYFVLKMDEALTEFGITAPNGLVVLTESGYLMLVKSFTDDLAWEVQRQLVHMYFRTCEAVTNISRLSPQLQALINMELRQNEQEQKIAALEARSDHQEKKMEEVVEIFAVPSLDRDLWQQNMNKYISSLCERYGLSQQVARGELYKELELQAGVNLSSRRTRMQNRMKRAGAKAAERQSVTKLSVVAADKKLRPIFEGICRQYAARLSARVIY